MENTPELEKALALVLKLSPKERRQLIEQVAASVEHESETDEPDHEHWGKALNRLLDELEPIEFTHPEIDDPVEWVKQQREDERKKRLGDWGESK